MKFQTLFRFIYLLKFRDKEGCCMELKSYQKKVIADLTRYL